jgi:hypothetical protein
MMMIDLPDDRLRQRGSVTATGCWEWTGARTKWGYGRISWHGHVERVHRVVASLVLGLELTDERVVCHRCDNPPCYNPAHLFVGTLSDNTQDMLAKGRAKAGAKPSERCKNGHLMEEARIWRGRFKAPRCGVCRNAAQREYYHRRMAKDPVFRARKR